MMGEEMEERGHQGSGGGEHMNGRGKKSIRAAYLDPKTRRSTDIYDGGNKNEQQYRQY